VFLYLFCRGHISMIKKNKSSEDFNKSEVNTKQTENEDAHVLYFHLMGLSS